MKTILVTANAYFIAFIFAIFACFLSGFTNLRESEHSGDDKLVDFSF